MTKSTITRERLEKIKSWRETYGAGSNVMLPAEEAEELARIALAAMDSEPVAWTDEEELRDVNVAGIGYLFGIDREANKFADPRRQIMLYRHAQQPTVAGDGRAEFETWMLKRWGRERRDDDFAMGKFIYGEDYADSYTRCVWKAWSASRAAMLAAALQPQNAPQNIPEIIPGWIPVSEQKPDCWCLTCRPVVLNDMRFVVCPDCGNKRCPRANDHRNACAGSNEPGQEGSAYPAAPQEVRGE